MRKTSVLLVLLALLSALTVNIASPTSAARPTGDSATSARSTAYSASRAARAGREPLARWRCGKWKAHGGIGWRYCAKLTSFDDRIKIDYRERFYNRSNRYGKVACEHQKTTSWNFHVSGTGEAEAGVIFAKAKVSITAGIARHTETTRKSSVTISHPPKSYVYCERGIHGYNFRGYTKKVTCYPGGCHNSGLKSFKGSAPEANFWEYGDGRGGARVRP